MNMERAFATWTHWCLTPDKPGYRSLADALEKGVIDGQLLNGDRLPSHRQLARELKLSVGTVSKAYQEAEERGIISSHVGRGTFVNYRPGARTDTAGRDQAVDLRCNLSAEENETKYLSDAFAEMMRERDPTRFLLYPAHNGFLTHREILSESLSDRRFIVDPERLFLCNGAQHAIDIALRLVANSGDSILVAAVTYSGIKAIAEASHFNLVPVEMDQEGINPESLIDACRGSRARVLYCMPTLQSPTARTMSLARRRRIAEVAEEFNLAIIEDDVYGFFFAEKPLPITSLIPDRSFYVTSYSKCVAPGLRLGTLTVPKKYLRQAELLMHASSWFVAPILSGGVVRLIENGKLEELLRGRRRQALERYRLFLEVFPKVPRIRVPASHVWLPLPEEWGADQFAAAAQSCGILVTPPMASAVVNGNPGGIRLCLGAPKQRLELLKILQILSDILRHQPQSVFSVA
jgi:DNA-binding transcriptional MocR family regulator